MGFTSNFLGAFVPTPYQAANANEVPRVVSDSTSVDLLWAIWQALGGGGGGAAALTDSFLERGIADGPDPFTVAEDYCYAFTLFNNTDTVIKVVISNDGDATTNEYLVPASGTQSITRNKVTEPALGNIIDITDYSGDYTTGSVYINFTY